MCADSSNPYLGSDAYCLTVLTCTAVTSSEAGTEQSPRQIKKPFQSHPTVVAAVVGLTNNVHVQFSSSSEELPVSPLVKQFQEYKLFFKAEAKDLGWVVRTNAFKVIFRLRY